MSSTETNQRPMTPTETYWTLQTGLKYAGSFFRPLCEAGLKADPGNKAKLLRAFPELEEEYGPASVLYLGPRPPSRQQ